MTTPAYFALQNSVFNQRELVKTLALQHLQAEEKLNTLQWELANEYKSEIVRKFLKIWEEKLPEDEELFHVVLWLAGSENEKKAPQTLLKFDNNNELHFKYYNERLEKWVELTP